MLCLFEFSCSEFPKKVHYLNGIFKVLDKIENRGIEIGETRGRKIGEKLGEVKALYFYMKKTPDEIGKIINMNEAEVMSVIKEIEKRKDI